jgi:hypothetical protein
MVNRIVLPLEQREYTALLEVAVKELRNPADQARFILRQELERRGLLPIADGGRQAERAAEVAPCSQ